MNENIERYVALYRRLEAMPDGEIDSPAGERLLDDLDDAWFSMTDEEMTMADAQCSGVRA